MRLRCNCIILISVDLIHPLGGSKNEKILDVFSTVFFTDFEQIFK